MKNTVMLYVRMLLIMGVSLFTSRVILNTLGVEDFGTYNVVGGVVTFFSAFSGMFSGAISRFLTYELGKNSSAERLNRVFSTSVSIQILLALICILVAEILGLWFLNYKLVIPDGRMIAANWVLQCSIITFAINLISVPYNAAIIAHERMSAFAYISVFEVVMKLAIVYTLYISPFDKLISYAILLMFLSALVRFIYGNYCRRHFEECHYTFLYDKRLVREMSGFAGWNFLGSGTYMLNTQGINMLINMFFGVSLNAARGIANQVDQAIMQFVTNFLTALKPQITKNIAAGNTTYVISLICQGAKFGYFLMLFFMLPILLETPQILTYWLKTIPEYSIPFVRLAIVSSMIDQLGTTLSTAVIATGKVKEYYIVIGLVGLLVFPLTYVAFRSGFPPTSAYISFIIIYAFLLYLKLHQSNKLIKFPTRHYFNKVIGRIVPVTIIAFIFPGILVILLPPTFSRLILVTLVSTISCILSIYLWGMDKDERLFIKRIIKNKLSHK